MLKISTILAVGALLASPVAAAADDQAQRYRLDLRVTEQGRDVAATQTFITVDEAVSLNLSAPGEHLSFDAALHTPQGDGDADLLVIEINLVLNGEELAAPRMVFRRDSQARVDIGMEGGDGVRITVGPAD